MEKSFLGINIKYAIRFFYRFKREMYVNIFQLIILPQSIS